MINYTAYLRQYLALWCRAQISNLFKGSCITITVALDEIIAFIYDAIKGLEAQLSEIVQESVASECHK